MTTPTSVGRWQDRTWLADTNDSNTSLCSGEGVKCDGREKKWERERGVCVCVPYHCVGIVLLFLQE